MKFQVRAKVEKILWSNEESFMYKIIDIDSQKQKQWVVFTKQRLEIGSSCELAGYISESKDKKTKDENGRDIWKATFNAEFITPIENFNQAPEPSFGESDDIPF